MLNLECPPVLISISGFGKFFVKRFFSKFFILIFFVFLQEFNISLKKAQFIVGQNVKFELSGQLNNETGSLKLPGTYCPEYELNASFGTIPIFGPVLTGGDNNCMFSLPFQILRESWGEPTLLRRNTTGLLAPGILRDAFDYD